MESIRILRRELLPLLGHRPAIQVTRRELQDEVLRARLAKAPRVATQLLSRIRCAYAYAIEQGRLPDDFFSPTLGIKGAPQVRRKCVLNDAELATLLKWLPHSPYSRTVCDALSLVLLTACRSGEIVPALWRDIDLEWAVWSIRETKNGKPHDDCGWAVEIEATMLGAIIADIVGSTYEFDSCMPDERPGATLSQTVQQPGRHTTTVERPMNVSRPK